jgi:tetratricopeptide (TPR) repeat protein
MESQEQQLFAQFERYLSGALPAKESEQLEEQMEEDPFIRQEFEDFIRIKKLGYAAGRMAEKEALHAISSSRHQGRLRRRRLSWLAAGAVAASLLILLALSSIRFAPSSPTPQELFASHFVMPETPATLGALEDSLFHLANLAFDQEEYSQALAIYQSINSSGLSALDQSQLRLYEGLCQLTLGEPASARTSFAQARQHPEQAEWYLALSWLKEGKPVQAADAMRAIVRQPNHFYQEKAGEVLRMLGEK